MATTNPHALVLPCLHTHRHAYAHAHVQAGDKEAALLDAQAAVELAPYGFHNVGCGYDWQHAAAGMPPALSDRRTCCGSYACLRYSGVGARPTCAAPRDDGSTAARVALEPPVTEGTGVLGGGGGRKTGS